MDERSCNRFAGFVRSLDALSQVKDRDLFEEFRTEAQKLFEQESEGQPME